jgi:8-oxo-dGTP diphosphatase
MAFAPLSRLPKGMLVILKEAARHILRRPVIGVAAAARTADGRWVLIRRADTGTWGLPGGTLEWGETLNECLARELLEEAGVTKLEVKRLVGAFSAPDRDPRFHAVTVLVECLVESPAQEPVNPLEILEVALFEPGTVPELALGQSDMLRAAESGDTRFE